MSRYRVAARVSSFIAIAALGGSSAAIFSSSGADGETPKPAMSLSQYLDQFYGTLSSPIYDIGDQPWDLAIVTPKKSFVGQFQVLTDDASGWTVARRLPDPTVLQHPPISQWALPRGHYAQAYPTTGANRVMYFQSVDVGPAVPAVAVFYTGAAGWGALVIDRFRSRWEIAPFAEYGTGILPDPVFSGNGIVQTTANDCSPDCAGGHLTIRKFRFSLSLGRFEQFYLGGAGRPGRPDG
jgi:hypothetical protein